MQFYSIHEQNTYYKQQNQKFAETTLKIEKNANLQNYRSPISLQCR